MSRLGRKPVAVPSGVTVSVTGQSVVVKGQKGEMSLTLLPEVSIAVDDAAITVTRKDNSRRARERHGLTRQLLANMVTGVTTGFTKKLEIIGVGYKTQLQGNKIILHLGFSHPIELPLPQGIEVVQDEKNKNLLTIQGIDKQVVGQIAADIRSFRPPEPYKGKGIRYTDEHVRRKAGKTAAGATGGKAA